MAGRDQELARPLDAFGRGEGRRHDLGRRHEIGRVDRMHHEAAMAARDMLGEARRQERRGRARDDGILRRETVELGEDLALHLDALGRALLHMRGAGKRRAEIGRNGDARQHGLRRVSAQKPVRRELRQHLADEIEGLARGFGDLVEERDLMPGPREGDRPGAPDETRADDGHSRHG
jgi:hypothetical protein